MTYSRSQGPDRPVSNGSPVARSRLQSDADVPTAAPAGMGIAHARETDMPDGHEAHAAELRMLEADARYARKRAALYRARAWVGRRATSDSRMRHLDFVEKATRDRLRRARAKGA